MEQRVTVRPTVIVSDLEGDETYGFVTATPTDLGEALIVFRGPEEAFRFQADTGLYPAEEGYRVVSMNHKALDTLLKFEGIEYVAMPEPWTGKDSVDLFEAADFIEMLEESPRE